MLKSKKIWITGASSGIGEQLTYDLAADNELVISARTHQKLQDIQSQLSDSKIHVLPLDLADYTQAEQWAKAAIDSLGHLDMVILNGGISQRSLISETSMEVYEKLIQVDYLANVAIARALLPHFVARGAGTFVVVTSLMGLFSSPFRGGYCGAKHALHGFFDTLRLEYFRQGIQVTIICPGFVQTRVSINALQGNGQTLGTLDQATDQGMDVRTFSKKMIKAIALRKFEAYIGGKEIIGVLLMRISKRLLHYVISKSKVR